MQLKTFIRAVSTAAMLGATALATSVDPPPMSMQSERVPGGFPCRTPRQMSRASSIPLTTSSFRPASARARRTISSRLRASRNALVATARTWAPCLRHRAA